MSLSWVRRLPALVLSVLWLAAGSGYAQQEIYEILAKGNEWTLQVNGEVATLSFLGGRVSRNTDGGYELKYDVDWGGRPGALTGGSDATNSIQRVTLNLALSDGSRIECRGFIARGNPDMLAGVCGDRDAPGAWYAVRSGSVVVAGGEGQAERSAELQARIEELTQDLTRSRGRAAATAAELSRLQSDIVHAQTQLENESEALRQCRRQVSDARSSCRADPPPVNSYRNRLTGRYQRKDDSASPIAFPPAPAANSDLARWLAAHNGALLDVLEGLYPQPEIAQFLSAERNACSTGGLYCRVAFRQQAIGYALANMR